jgi:hypothetical protein
MFDTEKLGKYLVNDPSCVSTTPGVTSINGFRNNIHYLDASFDKSWIGEGCQQDIPFTCKYSVQYQGSGTVGTQQAFTVNVLRLTMPCTNAGCTCQTQGSAGSSGQRFFITG